MRSRRATWVGQRTRFRVRTPAAGSTAPIPARRQRWRRVTAAGRVHVASSAPMPAESHSRCCRRRRLGDKDLDRQRVVDHIAAEVRVVAVWLQALVRTLGASQKCIPTGLRRRDPVVSPAPPRITVYRIEELALDHDAPPSTLTQISVTTVSPAHAAPKIV